ncbi:MAG: hypothetical protein VB106_05300 [Clostridiaceae bacterium]|nr:hypothetical protein [Clostridiaceae bacterium]
MKTLNFLIVTLKKLCKRGYYFIEYFNSEDFYKKLCTIMWEDIDEMPFYEGCPYPAIREQFGEHIWHKHPELFTYNQVLYRFHYNVYGIFITDDKNHIVGKWKINNYNQDDNIFCIPDHKLAMHYNNASKANNVDVTPMFVRKNML